MVDLLKNHTKADINLEQPFHQFFTNSSYLGIGFGAHVDVEFNSKKLHNNLKEKY